jgi:hypothetical protein
MAQETPCRKPLRAALPLLPTSLMSPIVQLREMCQAAESAGGILNRN